MRELSKRTPEELPEGEETFVGFRMKFIRADARIISHVSISNGDEIQIASPLADLGKGAPLAAVCLIRKLVLYTLIPWS